MKKNASRWNGSARITCKIGTSGQTEKTSKKYGKIKIGVVAAAVVAAIAVPVMTWAAYGDETYIPAPSAEVTRVTQRADTEKQAQETASAAAEVLPSAAEAEEGTEETTDGAVQAESVAGEVVPEEPAAPLGALEAPAAAVLSGAENEKAEAAPAEGPEAGAQASAAASAAPSAESAQSSGQDATAQTSADQTQPVPSPEQTETPEVRDDADPAPRPEDGADINLVGTQTGLKSTLFTEGLDPDASDPLVAVLQVRLMELGYMEQDEPTELYGPLTVQGVTRAQRCNGLPQTGSADLNTIQVLMSADAKAYEISEGAEGDDVREVQLRLQIMDYLEDSTGYYGTETVEAVRAFQRTNGLTETGVVTLADKQALFADTALTADGQEIGEKTAGAEALIAVAEQQLGKPYSLGAKGADAFDCSGLVYYCLNQSGYSIEYMTSGGWASSDFPTISSMDELVRGDIVCFSGHVGIYIGDGLMIDASTSENRMKVSSDIRTTPYWSGSFLCGKRIF